ncbi:hypothetical protein AAAA73_00460 [Bdellovibrio sp. GT3]
MGRPLAILRELNKEVRYKYARDFFWKDARDGRKVYDGSQIFVGPKSSAYLVFAENRKVRLNEETLLRLSQVEQNPTLIALQINDGGLNLKSGKGEMDPLVLNLDDGKFKIVSKDAYDIYVRKLDKKLSLSVAAGHLTLQNVTGKTEIAAGSSIVLESNATPEGGNTVTQIVATDVGAVTFNLLAPYDGEIIREQSQPQFFKWEVSDATSVHLQYSPEPDFAKDLVDIDVSSQQFFPIPLNTIKGDVFWRLIAYKDGTPVFSKSSFFKVGRVEDIRVVTSAPAYIRKGVWKIQTTIENDDAKSKYDFQVSTSESFTTLHDAFLGLAPFSSLLDSPGNFYVRARKNFGNGLFSPWSQPSKVVIRESLQAPKIDLGDRTEDKVGNVITELKWNPVPAAAQYTIQSSNSAGFPAISSQKTITTTETAVQHSSARKVYYRVIAVSEEGEHSEPSNIVVSEGSTVLQSQEQKRLALENSTSQPETVPTPASALTSSDEQSQLLLLPLDGSVFYTSDSIRFEWDPFFKNATVEMSQVSNFSQDVIKIRADKQNFTKINPLKRMGRYYWRLAFEQTFGKVAYSKTMSFMVSPALSTQIEKLSLKFVERGKWNLSLQIKGAKPEENFIMQASVDPTFAKVDHEIDGPVKNMIPLAKSGIYHVRARRAKGAAADWSNVMTQFVRPPLTAPSLDKPNETLAGADVARLQMKWSDVKFAAQYIVELNNTDTFGSVLRSYKVPENTYSLLHSQRDASYIRVLAQSAEGELSPPSNIVKVKGLLAGPTIEKYEIAYANLDSKDSVDQLHILWTHRKNAAKYVVEVSRSEKFEKAQRFETKNIEFFAPVKDIGWYYFRVTPISTMADFFFSPTTVFAIEFKKVESLQLATAEEPANGAKFAYNNGQYTVVFKWGQTLGAGWYDFEIAQNPEFKESKLIKVEARQYRLPAQLKNGTWYYRLRGRNPNQASPWSPTKTFTLQN